MPANISSSSRVAVPKATFDNRAIPVRSFASGHMRKSNVANSDLYEGANAGSSVSSSQGMRSGSAISQLKEPVRHRHHQQKARTQSREGSRTGSRESNNNRPRTGKGSLPPAFIKSQGDILRVPSRSASPAKSRRRRRALRQSHQRVGQAVLDGTVLTPSAVYAAPQSTPRTVSGTPLEKTFFSGLDLDQGDPSQQATTVSKSTADQTMAMLQANPETPVVKDGKASAIAARIRSFGISDSAKLGQVFGLLDYPDPSFERAVKKTAANLTNPVLIEDIERSSSQLSQSIPVGVQRIKAMLEQGSNLEKIDIKRKLQNPGRRRMVKSLDNKKLPGFTEFRNSAAEAGNSALAPWEGSSSLPHNLDSRHARSRSALSMSSTMDLLSRQGLRSLTPTPFTTGHASGPNLPVDGTRTGVGAQDWVPNMGNSSSQLASRAALSDRIQNQSNSHARLSSSVVFAPMGSSPLPVQTEHMTQNFNNVSDIPTVMNVSAGILHPHDRAIMQASNGFENTFVQERPSANMRRNLPGDLSPDVRTDTVFNKPFVAKQEPELAESLPVSDNNSTAKMAGAQTQMSRHQVLNYSAPFGLKSEFMKSGIHHELASPFRQYEALPHPSIHPIETAEVSGRQRQLQAEFNCLQEIGDEHMREYFLNLALETGMSPARIMNVNGSS